MLAWRGAKRASRHRAVGLVAWRAVRWYLRRRKLALQLAIAAAVALGGSLGAAWSRRRRASP